MRLLDMGGDRTACICAVNPPAPTSSSNCQTSRGRREGDRRRKVDISPGREDFCDRKGFALGIDQGRHEGGMAHMHRLHTPGICLWSPGPKRPRWLIEWLDLIPVAILSALIFSDLFVTSSPPAGCLPSQVYGGHPHISFCPQDQITWRNGHCGNGALLAGNDFFLI